METANDHHYMRVKQVAKHFAVVPSTVWVWTTKPGFPKPLKIGKRVTLFDAKAIQKWIDENQ